MTLVYPTKTRPVAYVRHPWRVRRYCYKFLIEAESEGIDACRDHISMTRFGRTVRELHMDQERKRPKLLDGPRAIQRATEASGNALDRRQHSMDLLKEYGLGRKKQGRVVIAIDCSGSMLGSNKLAQAKDGASRFAAEAFGKGYVVGLVSFSSDAELRMSCTRDQADFNRATQLLAIEGSTNMFRALEVASSELTERRDVRAIVIATDGYPDHDIRQATLDRADLLKKEGVEIIAVGTVDADHGFLKQLASRDTLAEIVGNKELGAGITRAANLLPSVGNSPAR